MTEYHLPSVLKRNITVELNGQEIEFPLNWADGMLGAIPVFDTLENAEKYCKGHVGDVKYFVMKDKS